MIKTPVAFLIFNRPDTTQKVFDAIRQAKPEKLLVVADGPRADRPGEAEKCAAARSIIDSVDWECEVLTNYSDVNLGCKKRVASGLNWVFENVEEAIILEDDCLPEPTFFLFCEELLEYYRYDTRIMHISGCNYGVVGSFPDDQSYYFSKVPGIWGWATWRRAWKWYDVDISFWNEFIKQGKLLQGIFTSEKELKQRLKNWEGVHLGKIDTWDYSWHLTSICQGGLAIKPSQNLVSNIGFGIEATHTKSARSPVAKLKTEAMQFPLKHPNFMLWDSDAEKRYFQKMFKRGLLNRFSSHFKMVQLALDKSFRKL
jgi:hypothetical protein